MGRPLRILTIFGTRPEAIKLFPLIHKLAADRRFISRVCVSAQHRAMLDQVLEIADVVPDYDLNLMQPNQSLDSLTAALLTRIGSVLDEESPDWVVVQGDTATAMGATLAAYYRKMPVAHVEAGLRSGNIYHPWPEEVNRKIIGSIAQLHCAPTQIAVDALRKENVPASTIHITGNTVVDALQWITSRIKHDPDLASGLAELERRFAGKRVIAVTTHRRENFGRGMDEVADAIRRIAARNDVAIVFPVHLNPNVRQVMESQLGTLDNVAMVEPLDYPHFARLLDWATLILTDSGGVQEEAPALGKPVLVMRQTTERPEGIAAGTAILVGTDPDRIFGEVSRLLDNSEAYEEMARAHNPFGDGKSAGRIADLLSECLPTG